MKIDNVPDEWPAVIVVERDPSWLMEGQAAVEYYGPYTWAEACVDVDAEPHHFGDNTTEITAVPMIQRDWEVGE